MATLTIILAALVLLTLWDTSEAEDSRDTIPARANDRRSLPRSR